MIRPTCWTVKAQCVRSVRSAVGHASAKVVRDGSQVRIATLFRISGSGLGSVDDIG